MQRIFLFFFKYNGVFAFVILQIIALSLYFTGNSTENKRTFISSSNNIIGVIYESSNRMARYWNLAAVNDSLARENAELKMRLPSSKFSSLVEVKSIKDSTLQQQYQYIEAKVVNNTVHRPHNYITINRGSQQGVVAHTGVVNAGSNGIVGIAQKVGDNYTIVMSILNTDIHLSAKIKRNNYFGSLSWDGQQSKSMLLEAIPKHADIIKGDTIVTSGYSTLFPEGIMIGIVDTFYIPAGLNFYDVKVNLVNDMSAIQYVYIVNNLLREERIKLEEEVANEH